MQDLNQYRQEDGTYVSPRNGKTYKSEKALRAHLYFKKTDKFHNFKELNSLKDDCKYCNKQYGKSNLKKHESRCFLNPEIVVYCKICNNPIKNYKANKATCSRSCSNKYFRIGENNGNWKGDESSNYARICYSYHKKECVVCGENLAVDVHHIDHNRENNSPENLIPLCPTHHAYCHRNLYYVIEEQINRYIKNFRV